MARATVEDFGGPLRVPFRPVLSHYVKKCLECTCQMRKVHNHASGGMFISTRVRRIGSSSIDFWLCTRVRNKRPVELALKMRRPDLMHQHSASKGKFEQFNATITLSKAFIEAHNERLDLLSLSR
ncbi:hypothetical protein B0G57_1269 [Trinickia symbiotica]|nr:hypothetical protein B0G57_1269 [Trinickia symbiotica]